MCYKVIAFLYLDHEISIGSSKLLADFKSTDMSVDEQGTYIGLPNSLICYVWMLLYF